MVDSSAGITVSVVDQINPLVQTKIAAIAAAATDAALQLAQLQASINALSIGNVNALVQAVSQTTQAVTAAQSAQTQLNTATQQAQTVLTQATTAQNTQTDSITKTTLAQQKLADQLSKTAAAQKIASTIPQTSIQQTINNSTGVNTGGFGNAAASAQTLGSAEQYAAQAAAIKAAIDPATASQQKFNAQISQAKGLLDAGSISQQEFTAYEKLLTQSLQSGSSAFAGSATQLSAFEAVLRHSFDAIAAGRPATTTLLSETGNLSYSFGSLGGAVSAALAFIGPFGVAALGLGTTIAALATYLDLSTASLRNFNNVINATGNGAGTTFDQIQAQAEALAQSTNRSTASVQTLLTTIVSSNQFTGPQVLAVGTAIEGLSKLTDSSVADVQKQFANLSKSPVQFATQMQEAYNLFTSAQITAIDNLVRQGQAQDAVNLTLTDLNQNLGQRAPASLGYLETAWNSVKNATDDAITSALNYGRSVSDVATVADKIKTLQNSIKTETDFDNNTFGGVTPATQDKINQQQQQIDGYKQIQLAINQTADAQGILNKIQLQAGPAASALADENTRVSDSAIKLADDYEKVQTQIKQVLLADPKNATALQAQANLPQIYTDLYKKDEPKAYQAQQQAAATQTQQDNAISKVNNDLDSQINLIGLVGDESKAQQIYDKESNTLAAQGIDLTSQKYSALNDSINQKAIIIAQGQYDKDYSQLLDKTVQSLTDEVARMGELAPQREVDQQFDQVKEAFLNKKLVLQAGDEASIRDLIQAQQDYKAVQQESDTLYNAAINPAKQLNATIQAGSQLYQDGQISATAYYNAIDTAQEKVLEQQNTVNSGLQDGFLKLKTQYSDIAGPVSQQVVNSFNSMNDALATFVTTGKVNFTSLVDTIVEGFIKIELQKEESSLFSSLAGQNGPGLLASLGSTLGLTSAAPASVPGTASGLGSLFGDAGSGAGLAGSLSSLFGGGSAAGAGAAAADSAPDILQFGEAVLPAALAGGGQFTVGGVPGVDRNLVSLRLTQGEIVSVKNKTQQAADASQANGTNFAPNINVTLNGIGKQSDINNNQSQLTNAILQVLKTQSARGYNRS